MNIGIIAGIVMGSSYIPYIGSILRGHTKPERGSRIIWTALAFLAFYSQYSAGATDSLWLTGAFVVSGVITLLLSITHGEYGMSPRDIHIYFVVAAAIAISIIYNNPLLSLLMIVSIDASGTYLTVRKVMVEPHSENLSSYVIGAIGAALAVTAVGEINVTLLIYPAYIVLLNILVSSIMIKKRRLVPAQW